ncbi:Alg9-like mannosyltransferase family-domain-containing protein [Fomitopsis betulina]|nr:Alg9-like mannosyltransferase family-domain-containing protein [Fomitopsis betulina]
MATITTSNPGSSWKTAQWNRTYIVLLLLRFYFALRPGYIYPDEYDRGKEVIAGGLRSIGVYTGPTATCGNLPCRSLYPSIWSSQLLLIASNWNWKEPAYLNPYVLFAAERVSLFLFSIFLDSTVLGTIADPEIRARAAVLLSSSYMMLTYQVRQYSTSIEAVMLALSFSVLRVRWEHGKLPSQKALIGRVVFFTLYCVTGVFTGPSFLAVSLPIIYDVTVWSIHNSTYATAGKPRRAFWTHWIQFMAVPAIVGLVLTSFIIFLDTAVWWKETQHSLTIIPLNWLRGGLSTGITTDQRGFTLWKHPLVSLLWVVGPGLLFYGFRAAREIFRPAPPAVALSLDPEDVDWENENTSVPPNYSARHSRVILDVIIGSMAVFSILWHQEPRVLTPLLVPFVLIVARTTQIRRMGRAFWIPWVVSNVVLSIVFGIFHQGGVIPSLMNLHDHLGHINRTAPPDFNGTLASVVYWKTYPPQWHMLVLSVEEVASGKFKLRDLKDTPSSQLIEHLITTAARESLVVAPLHALEAITEEERKCFELRDRMFPHLDSDHMSEARAMGWKDVLTLGIFTVDINCLEVEARATLDVGVDIGGRGNTGAFRPFV